MRNELKRARNKKNPKDLTTALAYQPHVELLPEAVNELPNKPNRTHIIRPLPSGG